MDGWKDGRTDGRTDGRMDGRTDGRTEVKQHTPSPFGERGYNNNKITYTEFLMTISDNRKMLMDLISQTKLQSNNYDVSMYNYRKRKMLSYIWGSVI